MSKLGPKCQYFVWPPFFSSTALTLLGMEFTRASQIATGVLFHSSMMTSRRWWMLETLCSNAFYLRMPRRLPVPSASLARQWLSWRCVWGSVDFGRHFWFSLSLYLETKMFNSLLSHILVIRHFHSFSRLKVIAFYSTFSQTAVTNIYFGRYFMCSIQTKIFINSSLFRPNSTKFMRNLNQGLN